MRAARFFTAALGLSVATAVLAGGPIYTYDPVNRIPFAWTMSSWPNGQVPVYTDLGPLGILSNEQADALVANAVGQWSSVATSSFRATVAGDFATIGLDDTSSANGTSVLATFNGGGIHVIYDHDGSILSDYFGVPPTVVLGITDIEYVDDNAPEIVEAWMILSGPGVQADDPSGIGFAGVVTHEMGHALNLAHTQANGATLPSTFLDPPQPTGCAAPWTGAPNDTHGETMYPYITPEPGSTGEFMATVDQLDDTVALSDLYPGPGWPASKGTIRGQILDFAGNPVIGINVIARNVSDPFHDSTSYISGQVSKGQAGPDGSYVINGLTPGASYVLYVDQLLNGAFSLPRPIVPPGPEEYSNGALESGDGSTDNRCAWSPVTAVAGAPVTRDITFNHFPGGPTFMLPPEPGVETVPYDITPDGGVIVGGIGLNGEIFRWDLNADTFESVGGNLAAECAISDDGLTIAANVVDVDGINKAAIHRNGAWTILPTVPGSVACDNSSAGPTKTLAYDISGDGLTVVGMSFGTQGCGSSTIRGFKWTATGGIVALPKFDAPSRASRANAVNYDGSVIVGWDDSNSGQRRGVQWRSGVASLIKRGTSSVGEALDVSRDGQYIVGGFTSALNAEAWRWYQPTGVELLGTIPGQDGGLLGALSDDASVITGHTLDFDAGTITPNIWTSGLGLTNFNQFLSTQGVATTGLGMRLGMAMSANGHTITGFANGPYGYTGWVLKIPTALVCHASGQTLAVEFPHGLDEHLIHGDTLGPCVCNATAPTGSPQLLLGKPAAGTAHLEWGAIAAATGYDLARGSLAVLRSSGGDFSAATTGCLDNDLPATSRDDADTPGAGDGFWYVIRAVNCGGSATFDSGAPSQVGSRDAEIQASPEACP